MFFSDDSVNGWVEDEPVLKTAPAPPKKLNPANNDYRKLSDCKPVGRGRGMRSTFEDTSRQR